MKFLVIRFSSIGDIVLTTPALRCLKQQVPNAEIHFLTKRSFSEILINNPYIDQLQLIDHNPSEIISILKKEKYDYIIDLHRNLRSQIVKSALKVKSFSFDKLNFSKWLLVYFRINRLPAIHIVDRYFETLRSFGVKNDLQGLDYFLSPHDKVKLELLPENFQSGYFALVLGGSYFTKKIPISQLLRICEMSSKPIVLLGGKEDAEHADVLVSQFGAKLFNACGKFTINQSASLIQQSQRVFSSDTGLMHIAAAFKKDIISFWGNTVPEFGMTPYFAGQNSVQLEVKGLSCRPCSKLGYKKCPRKHFRCMEDIQLSQDIFNQ